MPRSQASAEVRAAQLSNRISIQPGFLSRSFVRKPKLVCFGTILVPVLATVVVFLTKTFVLNDPSDRDYFIRGDLRTRQLDARAAARDEFDATLSAFIAEEASGGSQSDQDVERSERINLNGLSLIFRAADSDGVFFNDPSDGFASDANIMTPAFVAAMKRIEDEFRASPDYENFCWFDETAIDCNGSAPTCALYDSITLHPLLYGQTANGSDVVCGIQEGSAVKSDAEFRAFLDALTTTDGGGSTTVDTAYRALLGENANENSGANTFLARTNFKMGYPLAGFASASEDEGEQNARYRSFALDAGRALEKFAKTEVSSDDSPLTLTVVGGTYANAIFGAQALTDLSFAVGAIVLVMLFIWFHTGSLFLAGSAMLQVLLAFPLAYFVYRLVVQVTYFSSLQIMTVFLILGIAADDVFVFTDAWKQAAVVLGADVDLERRMSWTYKRAVKAMSVTSFTTAMAFVVTATSSIMPIGTLGIWAAFLVLVQFLLLIFMYPCATIIWHRSLRTRKLSQRFAKGEEPVLQTAEDDAQELALAEAKAVGEDNVGEVGTSELGKSEDDEAKQQNDAKPGLLKRLFQGRGTQNESEYRMIERFFRFKWIFWMARVKVVLLVLALVLFALGIYFTTQLNPLSEEEAFLPSDHPLSVAFNFLNNGFPASDSQSAVRPIVIWGVSDIDRSGKSRYNPSDVGSVVLDDTFDLKPRASQESILRACDVISGNANLVDAEVNNFEDCWIRDFQQWRNTSGRGLGFEDYATDAALRDDLREFFTFEPVNGSRPFLRYFLQQRVAFAEDAQRVVFTEIRYITTALSNEPYRVMFPLYEEWREQLVQLNADAPSTSNKAFATAGVPWTWMITQNELVRNAFQGAGIMLGVAFVMLSLSTLNIVVAFWAMLTIAGIVTALLSLIYLFGWELGITESVGIIIATGVSFDFASHVGNAYVESRSASRFDRTRDALTDLGISVLAGGLSTILAGSMLFFAVITFFRKFAVFVVATVGLSLVWSLTFLVAYLLVAGPQNKTGDLRQLLAHIGICLLGKRQGNASEQKTNEMTNDSKTDVESSGREGETTSLGLAS